MKIFLFYLLIHITNPTILSKSEIEHCYDYGSDGVDCKTRIKIHLTVENGQLGNAYPKIHFNP